MNRYCPSCYWPNSTTERHCTQCGVWLPPLRTGQSPFVVGQRVRIIAGPFKGVLGEVWSTWRHGDLAGRIKVRLDHAAYVTMEVCDVVQAMDDDMSGERFDGVDLVPVAQPRVPVGIEEQRRWANQWEAAE